MNALTDIAQQLRFIAETTGPAPAQHKLERGLTLTLQKQGQAYTLSLTRRGAKPSQAEEGICRRAFGVPEQGIVRYEFARGPYSIIRIMWKEEEQTSLPDVTGQAQAG